MSRFYYFVMIVLLEFSGGIAAILNSVESTTINPFTNETTTKQPSGYDHNIASGIVFMERGDVLISGDDWVVAKEFNITEVVTLVQEAKILFPKVKEYLESNWRAAGENVWDLQFFHDHIIKEIGVIEPIIKQIENKIKIFENMLPKSTDDSHGAFSRNKRFFTPHIAKMSERAGQGSRISLSSDEHENEETFETISMDTIEQVTNSSPSLLDEDDNMEENRALNNMSENMLNEKILMNVASPMAHSRDKRGIGGFFMNIIGGVISKGIKSFLFSDNKDSKDVQALNNKFEMMLSHQEEQIRQGEIREMRLRYLEADVTEIANDMKNVKNQIETLRQDQDRKFDVINSKISSTTDLIWKLELEAAENAMNIRKFESNLNIMQLVYSERLNAINKTLEAATKDVRDVKTELVKHYTILTDLDTRTQENKEAIYDVKKELTEAITNWEKSQKQMVEKLNLVVNITSTMRMMEMRLLHIDTYLTGLLEALDTVSTKRLSPNLVSPIQLVEILRSVSRNLPPGLLPLTLIEEDAVYEYYTYATVLALAIPSAIRVFIKLPLKAPNRMFTLYEPYSLPFYHEEAGIFLEIAKPSDYVLVSKDLQKVAEIPESYLEDCKSKNKMYLCQPTFPLYEGTKCSLSLIKEDEEEIIKYCERSVVVSNFKSKWIRAEEGWIYSIPQTLRIIRRHSITPPQLSLISGTGILRDIPQTYTHLADGTVLFPNDKLGSNLDKSKFKDDKVFIPRVPNLLHLNESSKIGKNDVDDVIAKLSKANSNSEQVNIYHLLDHVKLSLVSEFPQTSGGALVPVSVLVVGIIINYIMVGFVFWIRKRDTKLDGI